MTHDAHVGGVELLVDHGAVADKPADPQVALDQRRQRREHAVRVEPAGVEPAHVDEPLGQRPRPQRRRREVVVVEIGERRRQRIGVGAGQAGAAEHQRDVMMKHIGRDAAPQQLHDRPGAVAGIDAGAAELEDFAGIGDQRRDVVFGGRVERADPRRRVAPDQPVGADHRLGAAAAAVVEHQQVIADLVVAVAVAALLLGPGERPRAHDVVEDAVAQRLRRVDIGVTLRQPHLQRPGDDVDDAGRSAGAAETAAPGRAAAGLDRRSRRLGRAVGDHARGSGRRDAAIGRRITRRQRRYSSSGRVLPGRGTA